MGMKDNHLKLAQYGDRMKGNVLVRDNKMIKSNDGWRV